MSQAINEYGDVKLEPLTPDPIPVQFQSLVRPLNRRASDLPFPHYQSPPRRPLNWHPWTGPVRPPAPPSLPVQSTAVLTQPVLPPIQVPAQPARRRRPQIITINGKLINVPRTPIYNQYSTGNSRREQIIGDPNRWQQLLFHNPGVHFTLDEIRAICKYLGHDYGSNEKLSGNIAGFLKYSKEIGEIRLVRNGIWTYSPRQT